VCSSLVKYVIRKWSNIPLIRYGHLRVSVLGIMATEHQYRPLDISCNEIRLLRLAPSRSFAVRVSCSLDYKSLDDNISFEALSYTWGDTNLRRSIILDGWKFLVMRNLEIAPRHLRYVYDERLLWIDAPCINQRDVPEKNYQVPKMRQIYQRANKVVAWSRIQE
jgi:hypothetical protein